MGIVKLKWDNAAVLASINTTAQRVIKRLKTVGGAYDSLNFTPANDMAKAVTQAQALVIDNNVYEFIVQAICTQGGPMDVDNGPVEAMKFACILPTFSSTHNSVNVIVNLINTDIHKIRVRLKKQSDDSVVGTFIASRSVNTATAIFNTLPASTAYWVEIELYAVVNGVEVLSSDPAPYLNAVCGTNIPAYQVSTAAPPACPAPTNLIVEF